MNTNALVERRPYRMAARAKATEATRRAIADAWLELFQELHYGEITLDLVATRAGVSVQTVIRHFGSKDQLFGFVARKFAVEEAARRDATPVGDVHAAIQAVTGRYERVGGVILRLLADEQRLPALREAADLGRQIHSGWVDRVFAPHLDSLDAAPRRVRHGQLVALTDVLMWKLLRIDQGMERRRTEAAIVEMATALLGEAS